jgi:hypothetical protein
MQAQDSQHDDSGSRLRLSARRTHANAIQDLMLVHMDTGLTLADILIRTSDKKMFDDVNYDETDISTTTTIEAVVAAASSAFAGAGDDSAGGDAGDAGDTATAIVELDGLGSEQAEDVMAANDTNVDVNNAANESQDKNAHSKSEEENVDADIKTVLMTHESSTGDPSSYIAGSCVCCNSV